MRTFGMLLEQEGDDAPVEVYTGRHDVTHTENLDGFEVPFLSVDSSHIDEIGYNPIESKLYVRFLSRALYAYSDVDESEWRGFVDAGERGPSPTTSKGRYLYTFIKGSKDYQRLY